MSPIARGAADPCPEVWRASAIRTSCSTDLVRRRQSSVTWQPSTTPREPGRLESETAKFYDELAEHHREVAEALELSSSI